MFTKVIEVNFLEKFNQKKKNKEKSKEKNSLLSIFHSFYLLDISKLEINRFLRLIKIRNYSYENIKLFSSFLFSSTFS